MAFDLRPCLICNRIESDKLHQPERWIPKQLATEPPRIEHHAYDPGERRKLVRRMDDRIAKIENAVHKREGF